MNRGKEEVAKQEMAKVNIDILKVSELELTGLGEFNSDDHYICIPYNAMVKEFSCQCRRHEFDPWVRKIPRGVGNGNALQYSCLGNSMD